MVASISELFQCHETPRAHDLNYQFDFDSPPSVLSGKYSDILSSIYSDILFEIFLALIGFSSELLSGFLLAIPCGVLLHPELAMCHWVQGHLAAS